MGFSIQDYSKKINSSLTWLDCLSLLITTVLLFCLALYLLKQREFNNLPVSYVVGDSFALGKVEREDTRPFGSKNGKTYTFSWCRGQNMISLKNKIFYNNEDEAKKSGKVLSKFCQK
jgi:hypothetical protein